MSEAQLHTRSVDETRAVAAAIAALAADGDLVLLVGELGAGKTAFVQGFARALGVSGPVTSPTFTLVHGYEGTLAVHHVDAYRLGDLSEVADLGLGDLLDDGGVTLVEWGDVVRPAVAADYLEVTLAYDDADPDARSIVVRVVGPGWATRVAALRAALAPWGEPC